MKKPKVLNELVTVEEAAEIYGCTRIRIYQLINEGRLTPAFEAYRKKLFLRSDVEKAATLLTSRRPRKANMDADPET